MEKDPLLIQKESFRIITELLAKRGLLDRFSGVELSVVKRVVHATGDVSLAERLIFSEGFFESFCRTISISKTVVADVKMVSVGISRRALAGLLVRVYVDDEDVVKESVKYGVSRAYVSMDKALKRNRNAVFVIGNSPTALLRILEDECVGFVVGVPVGFVGAAEVKRKLLSSRIPHITLLGTRGGSSVAVAVVNALLMEAVDSGLVC